MDLKNWTSKKMDLEKWASKANFPTSASLECFWGMADPWGTVGLDHEFARVSRIISTLTENLTASAVQGQGST